MINILVISYLKTIKQRGSDILSHLNSSKHNYRLTYQCRCRRRQALLHFLFDKFLNEALCMQHQSAIAIMLIYHPFKILSFITASFKTKKYCAYHPLPMVCLNSASVAKPLASDCSDDTNSLFCEQHKIYRQSYQLAYKRLIRKERIILNIAT